MIFLKLFITFYYFEQDEKNQIYRRGNIWRILGKAYNENDFSVLSNATASKATKQKFQQLGFLPDGFFMIFFLFERKLLTIFSLESFIASFMCQIIEQNEKNDGAFEGTKWIHRRIFFPWQSSEIDCLVFHLCSCLCFQFSMKMMFSKTKIKDVFVKEKHQEKRRILKV